LVVVVKALPSFTLRSVWPIDVPATNAGAASAAAASKLRRVSMQDSGMVADPAGRSNVHAIAEALALSLPARRVRKPGWRRIEALIVSLLVADGL
jgi:hypothetical protein